MVAERARMARDLHDVIAGDLSAIAIQPEAALSARDDLETAWTVLGAVRENSVRALTEMRAMIGLLRCRGVDGIAATRVLVSERLCEVLVLTTFDLDEYLFAALRAGAAGFLLKSAEAGRLIEAVRSVASGDGILAPQITRRLIAAFADGKEPGSAQRSEVNEVAEQVLE